MFSGVRLDAEPLGPKTSMLNPDNKGRVDGVDWELGAPQGASDLTVRGSVWKSRLVGNTVEVSNDLTTWVPLITIANIDPATFTFSFDLAMRGMISYRLIGSSDIKLYWYDTTIPGNTTLTVTNAVSPFLTYDYPFDGSLLGAEVLWFYLRGTSVLFRRQSERFTVERTFSTLPSGQTKITGAGMGRNWRVHVRFGR